MQQHTSKQNMNTFPTLIDDDKYDLLGKQMFHSQQHLENYFGYTLVCQE
jgi:hypothetical protein